MNKGNRRNQQNKKLFANLFEGKKREDILLLLSEGFNALINNSERLFHDATFLLKEGRWTSGRFLLSTANEEMAMAYIIVDMCRLDFSRHENVLKCLCSIFYDHVKKYAYYAVEQGGSITSMKEALQEWKLCVEKWSRATGDEEYDNLPDAIELHETYFLREVPLYVEFLDYEKRWTNPVDEVAEYTCSMGAGVIDSETSLARLRLTRDAGLSTPMALSIVNNVFAKVYVTENTTIELLEIGHRKVAQQIAEKLSLSTKTYYESALNRWPLYSFAIKPIP